MNHRNSAEIRHSIAVICVLLLGASLRLYRLDEQSVWFDEMNALVHDPGAGLAAYLSDVRQVNPDHVPLFFVLLYGWTRLVSADPFAFRVFSVALGCVAIFLLYLLARRMFGSRAGLVAAMCLALSPLHIYLHQAIRAYALLDVMALTSLLLTLQAARGRSLWLLAHAVVCGVMVATHLTTALLVLVECLYLLHASAVSTSAAMGVSSVRAARPVGARALLLGALHGPSALYCLAWFKSMQGGTVSWYELPTLGQWLNDLLGDMVVYLNVDFMSSPLLLEIMDASTRSPVRVAMDTACLVFMGTILGCSLLAALRWGNHDAEHQRLLRLTVAVAILPMLLLTGLSFVWEPVIMPRYTQYSALALFILAGAIMSRLRPRYLQATAVTLLACLYGAQLALLLPNLARTDFRGAAAELRRVGAEGEAVTTLYLRTDGRAAIPNTARIFRTNLGDFPAKINMGYSLLGAIRQGMECLANADTSALPAGRSWILIEHWTGFPERPAFEVALAEAGVIFEHWESTNLHLYSLRAPREHAESYLASGMLDALFPEELGPDPDALATALVGSETAGNLDENVVAALEWAVPAFPLQNQEWPLLFESLRAMQIYPRAGRLMDRHAMNADRDYQLDHIISGLSFLAEGRHTEANQSFAMMDPEVAAEVANLVPGFEALASGDYDRARREVQDVSTRFPSRVPAFFRYLLGVTPPPCNSMLKPLL